MSSEEEQLAGAIRTVVSEVGKPTIHGVWWLNPPYSRDGDLPDVLAFALTLDGWHRECPSAVANPTTDDFDDDEGFNEGDK